MSNYTVTQAAKLLNCSRSQIFKYIKEGKLTAHKIDESLKNAPLLIDGESMEYFENILKGASKNE